jgi:hypothetical protein
MPKMLTTAVAAITNNNEPRTMNYLKRTQTNPILPAFAGKIAPLFRMSFILMGPNSTHPKQLHFAAPNLSNKILIMKWLHIIFEKLRK